MLIVESRIELIVSRDLRGESERLALYVYPAEEFVVIFQRQLILRHDFRIDCAVFRNIFDRFENLLAVHIVNGYGERRRNPFRVERNGVRGHGLAFEDELFAVAQLVVVPAVKDVIALVAAQIVFRLKVLIRNALLVFGGIGFHRRAAADELDSIAVAGVVELRVIVFAADLRAVLEGKAGQRILVFLGNAIAGARAGILMIQLIGPSAIARRSGLARQNFYIVVRRLRTLSGCRTVELSAVQRHGVDVDLMSIAAVTGRPSRASIIGRPLVRNVRAILRSDSQSGIFLRRRKPSGIRIELHAVHIALIVHLHDRGAVALNLFLGNLLRSEARIALRSCTGFSSVVPVFVSYSWNE